MNLTKDEILKMPAGVMLSIYVAEKVMKWQGWIEQRGGYVYFLWQKPREREPYRSYRDWEAQSVRYRRAEGCEYNPHNHIMPIVPEFSRSISAAWEVCEKINSIAMDTDENYQIKAGFLLRIHLLHGESAKDAALMICRTALSVVMEDK